MTQCDVILDAMLSNPQIKWWYAKDFLHGKYFVGYEATARMTDLLNLYPTLFNYAKDGRYRILAINWESKEEINYHLRRLNDLKNILEKEGE